MGNAIKMSKDTFDFHIAEYSMLRTELQQRFKQSQDLIFYSIIANGFIISWIATQKFNENTDIIKMIAIFIPLFISIFVWIMYSRRVKRQNDIYHYLEKLEDYLSQEGLGWHEYLSSLGNRGYGLFAPRHIYHAFLGVQLITTAFLPVIIFVYKI